MWSASKGLTSNHHDFVIGVASVQGELAKADGPDLGRLFEAIRVWGRTLSPRHEPKTTVADIRQSKLTETVIDIVLRSKDDYYRNKEWKALSRVSLNLMLQLRYVLESDNPDRWLCDDLRTDCRLAFEKPNVETGDDGDEDDEWSEETSDSSNRHDPPHYPKSKYNPYRMDPNYDGYESPRSDLSK
jgi:hypothetical protein